MSDEQTARDDLLFLVRDAVEYAELAPGGRHAGALAAFKELVEALAQRDRDVELLREVVLPVVSIVGAWGTTRPQEESEWARLGKVLWPRIQEIDAALAAAAVAGREGDAT